MAITLDFETRSFADLTKVGTVAYAEDPTTDVICCCWGIDNEPIQEWWPGKDGLEGCPEDLWMAIADGHEVEAHNCSFEWAIWTRVMQPRYGWPEIAEDKWRDTMAVACYYALPAKLDQLARVLGFEGKDPEGGRLITKYSKLYLKTAKKEIPDDDFKKFVAYCRKDVAIEQSISDYLGDLPDRELPVYLLDRAANRRGLYLDAVGIECAARIVDQRAEELTAEFRKLVGFNPTQVAKCQGWFATQGVKLDNMQADYLEEILEADMPSGPARRALEIRLQINKASTKKLDAMARQCSANGRALWQSRYHGAVTGRVTGSGFQPLNLTRGFEDVDPDRLVGDIMHGDAAFLDMVYGDAMEAVSKASRHWIMAEPGNKIIAGDFVSIEAVILACLAGEQWKIDAFRNGVKIYEHMADKIYGFPPGTVTKASHPAERQDGKTGELAFGYQGALNAWLKFDSSGRHTDERIVEICKAWRAEHPAIVRFWRGLEDAAIDAVRRLELVAYNGIGFEIVDEWLSMILLNGKRIWYFKPELRMAMPQWHQPAAKSDCAEGKCDCRPRVQLTYMSQKNGQWRRVSTYGGKLAENATQAHAREVLVPAIARAEAAGYGVILTVYDEIVCEVPANYGSVAEFKELMEIRPDWAADWPIRAEVWQGERYRK